MAGVREKLLTASDLAALCEVDLKTIHNWVDRGRIAHFRTPGRHLRFRAADVAEFLRAWGYSVPRELARLSSRSVLVVGTKDSLGLVLRSLGEGARAMSEPGAGPGFRPVAGVLSSDATRAAPGEPGAVTARPVAEASSAIPPVRHAKHPYDALIYAGSDPADVYVVDVRAVAADIDPLALLEALHRASPQASFVALGDEAAGLPQFATRVARGDAQGLKAQLVPTEPAAPAAQAGTGTEEAPRGIAAGGSSR